MKGGQSPAPPATSFTVTLSPPSPRHRVYFSGQHGMSKVRALQAAQFKHGCPDDRVALVVRV